ncbi:Alpha/Beta hydrolase protein [Aspergillus tetrazonus]
METFTHTFKEVDGLSLKIDVSKPKAADNGIALVHFHGGYLVFGEKTTNPPYWLINACRTRGWTYASPSYRLLPEAPGLDILSDALDAIRWVHKHISRNIIIAGSSAGGYLALASTANPTCPKPLAVLSNYGLLDPAGTRYVRPGQPLRAPVSDLPAAVGDVQAAMQSKKVLDGCPFPTKYPADARFNWVKALHEAAIFPDVLTRVRGLAQQILQCGVKVIPAEYRALFPVSFGLTRNFPPTILLHGDADDLVGFEQSQLVAENLRELGADVLLERAVGQGHGFEHNGFIDLDAGDGNGDNKEMLECLRRVVAALEKACTSACG